MELLGEILRTVLFFILGGFLGYVLVDLFFKPAIIVICSFLFIKLFLLLGVTLEGPVVDDFLKLLEPLELFFVYCGKIAVMIYDQSSLASKVLFYVGFVLACISMSYNKHKPIRQKLSRRTDIKK